MLTGDHWLFYPDIQAAGGLAPALDAEFAALGVTLDVHGFGAGGWAGVKANNRSCQVCIGTQEKIIMPDFWADGVLMGNLQTTDLHICAEATAAWLHDGVSLATLNDRFAIFRATDGAEAFESGRGVDFAWSKMDGWVARDLPRLTPLVEAAKHRPQLRQLLPFTSHESLHFSRSTGYLYTNDVAHAIPIGEGQYRALGPGYKVEKKIIRTEATGNDFHYDHYDYDILGEGDADHVIDLILSALPPNCGPAITGTAEDMVPKTSLPGSDNPQ